MLTVSVFHHNYTSGSAKRIKCEGNPPVLWEKNDTNPLRSCPGWDFSVQSRPISDRACCPVITFREPPGGEADRDRVEVSVGVAPPHWATAGSQCPDPPGLHAPPPLLPSPPVTRLHPALRPPPRPARQGSGLVKKPLIYT